MLHDLDFIRIVRTRRRIFAGLLTLAAVVSTAIGIKKVYFSPLELPRYQSYADVLKSYKKTSIQTEKGNTELLLEAADTDEERAQGLMFRQSLAKNSGMIFIFARDTQNPFWMKNTKLPLDILFIDAEKRIVDWLPMDPCTQDPCTQYLASKPYRYAIEVNKGWVAEHGVKIGDAVNFE